MTTSPPGRPGTASPGSPGTAPPARTSEADTIANMVRGCAGVAALDGGPFGDIASYLPGRVVPGVAVDNDRIRVQVRAKWGVPVNDLAARITAALSPLAGARPVDVTISDIDDPPADQTASQPGGEQ